jgi:predicted ATPase
LWLLGYPETALVDADRALEDARKIGHLATLMQVLVVSSAIHRYCGDYAAANARLDELDAVADEKVGLGSHWKAFGTRNRGPVLALIGETSKAVQMIAAGIAASRSTGSTLGEAESLSSLAEAYAKLDQFDDAWRCIGEAMTAVETTKERLYEAEVYRTVGEITLLAPESDVEKAEAHFEHALAVARSQQAKSWELRAAMSMARLWRDQGKRQQADDLLAPIYGWFTEGFDTLDLKEAKRLLEQLRA